MLVNGFNGFNSHQKTVNCDLCLQPTNQWITICRHHQPFWSSESEAESLSDDSGLGKLSFGNRIEEQNNYHFDFKWKVNYVLFGTFVFYCQPIEISGQSFYFPYISLSPSGIGRTYNLTISIEDIKQLLYCSMFGNFMLFIELNPSTSLLIETGMHLNDSNGYGLRFDVNSDDVVERYIVIDLDEMGLNPATFHRVVRMAKESKHVIVKEFTPHNVVRYLNNNYRKSIRFL